jgi:hypothetical protein
MTDPISKTELLRTVNSQLVPRLIAREVLVLTAEQALTESAPRDADQLHIYLRGRSQSHRGYCFITSDNESDFTFWTSSPLQIHFGTHDGRDFRWVAGLLINELRELGVEASWPCPDRYVEIAQ